MASRGGDLDLDLAGPATDLVAHVLAHVPVAASSSSLVRAACLFDRAYVAWAANTLPLASTAPIAEDAPLLSTLLARVPAGHALQWLLVLHEDVLQQERASIRSLQELRPTDVTSGEALAALRSEPALLPAVEIARCAIALAAPSYREAWARWVRPRLEVQLLDLLAALKPAAVVVPRLRAMRVRLSHPLGAFGRAFPAGVLVGPAGRGEAAASGVAVRVVHEVAARVAGEVIDRVRPDATAEARWATSEDLALHAASRRLEGSPLARPHAAFVAGLDRAALRADGRKWLDEVLDHLASSPLTGPTTRPAGGG